MQRERLILADYVLEVNNLETTFKTDTGVVKAVDRVMAGAGKTLGLVGESGCGKSVTSLSIMRLLPAGDIAGGEILLDVDGQKVDIKVRGFELPLDSRKRIAMICKNNGALNSPENWQTVS